MVDSRGTAGQVVALPARPLDKLGTAVAQGRTPGATTLAIEEREVRMRLSRTVVREVRVLETLAMVTSRRRVGRTVQPTRYWNVCNRWPSCGRPAGGRGEQLRSLTAVRSAAAEVAMRARPAEAARMVVAP